MLDSEEIEQSALNSYKDGEHYRRLKLLGQGAYGKAYLVECLKDHTKWVIKQINIADMSQYERDLTTREAKILESLDHPNIVKFREIYRTNKMKLNIVMEFADGGDLAAKIAERKKSGKLFDEVEILNWFTQICLAIKHVHDRKVIHRDIKGQNIFLTSDDIVKLGDFGIAKVLHQTIEKARTVIGTPYYLSPEIIENKPYSFKSDIWSLGVLLYELCALTPPFTGNSLQFLALRIVRGSYNSIPPVYSKGLQNLIRSMLNVDPNRRPSIHQILASNLLINRITNFLTESKKIDEFSHTILHKQNILKRPMIPKAPSSQSPDASLYLGAPPNLLRVSDKMPIPSSSDIEEAKDPHFKEVLLPPPAPKLPQKTPPVQHKTPMNGFYRPPSSHIPKPVIDKPDLADLLNIKANPLNTPVVKPQLPKIKTPDVNKKRPSTPNLGMVKGYEIIKVNRIIYGDFKKKQRYSDAGVKRNTSEDKFQKKEPQISPAVKAQIKSPQLGGAVMVPYKVVRKDSYASKPQSSQSYQKKKPYPPKTYPIPRIYAPKPKTEPMRAYQKPKPYPIVKVEPKATPKPYPKSKKPIKSKPVQKPKKKYKPLYIKSYYIKKFEKEEAYQKRQKRYEYHKKLKEHIASKRKYLSYSMKCQYEYKVNELPSEITEKYNDLTTDNQYIAEYILYGNEYFYYYEEQIPIFSNEETTASNVQPDQDVVNVKHSIEFKKMLDEMQEIVNHATDNVNKIEEKLPSVPNLQYMIMELTLPADREDDLETTSTPASTVNFEYSLSQADMALDCLADHSKLEDLKITLYYVFGMENFITAYRDIERIVYKNGLNFDEVQTVKKISEAHPSINENSLSKYFSLLVTLVVLYNNFAD